MAEELETAPAAEVQRNFSLWQDWGVAQAGRDFSEWSAEVGDDVG